MTLIGSISHSRHFLRLGMVCLLLLCSINLFSQISVEPNSWQMGHLEADRIFDQNVTLTNGSDNEVRFSFISTCGCLTVEPGELIIPPGETGVINLIFDTRDDRGDFEKILIIRSTDPSLPKAFFVISGYVEGDAIESSSETSADKADESGDLIWDYYHSPGCRSCTEFIEKKIPSLSEDTGIIVNLRAWDLTDTDVYDELEALLAERDVQWSKVPVLVAGDIILQGEEEITENLEKLITGSDDIQVNSDLGFFFAGKEEFLLLPVVLAGLLDGVNPCAFTTLIFLISALAVAGKSRREILVIGIFFTLSVYVTYYMVGAGFFGALRAASSFSWISIIIRWLLTGFLVVFAVLSFIDYIRVKQGRSNEILLQLPKSMKQRIHKSVRTYTRSGALVGSSIIMGFLISLFELGCTGQIYFPTITYMIRTNAGITGWLLLALYNLAFILPLVVVFIVTYRGVGSQKLARIFQKNLGAVKLFTTLLFVILAVLTIIT